MAQIKEFPSLKESVLDRIRKDIVTCKLRPGEPIRDTDLAARYGVSTSPIREALVHLAAERLVDMPPNRPKIVSPIDAQSASEFFAIYRIVALSTFSWAAPKLSKRDLDIMAAALEQMERLAIHPDGYKFLYFSNEFYLTAYEAAGNYEALDIITRSLFRIQRIILYCGFRLVPTHERRLFDCLTSGDFSGAIRAHFDVFDTLGAEIENLKIPESAHKPRKAPRRRQAQ